MGGGVQIAGPSILNADEAYARLLNASKTGRFAQGYIIAGPPQTVGREFAGRVLQMVFCESGTACGQCSNCVRVAAHRHPDVLWIEPHKKSRIIPIEDVRSLQVRMSQTAREGGWKGAVLVGADRLGPEASNAFLKTLEEPAPRTVFLLLSENPELMLTTVRSRCQMIALDGQSRLPAEVENKLLSIILDPAARGALSARGRFTGSFAQSEALTAMLKAIKSGIEEQEGALVGDEKGDEDVDKDVISARASARYRAIRGDVMRSLSMWYRDILVLACGGDLSTLHYPDRLADLQSLAGKVRVADALRRVNVVERMNEQLDRNLQEKVVFDNGMPMLLIA